MLPQEAKTYFESLRSAQSADSFIELAAQLGEFEKGELARGQSLRGTGYAARLAALYNKSLTQHTTTIVEALKTVHQGFNSPLDDGIEDQLGDWGARALSAAYQGLEGAYLRHLERTGLRPIYACGLELTYTFSRATVSNLLTRHFWQLRHVPALRPPEPKGLPTPIPVAPAFLTDAIVASSFRTVHHIQSSDVQTPADVDDLVKLLYDHPEDLVLAFGPKGTQFPAAFEDALANDRIRYERTEFHFYRPLEPMGDDDFFQVPPGAPSVHSTLVDRTQQFERHELQLTSKHRRALEIQEHLAERSKSDSSPLKLEPSIFGVGISLPKLLKKLSDWAKFEPDSKT